MARAIRPVNLALLLSALLIGACKAEAPVRVGAVTPAAQAAAGELAVLANPPGALVVVNGEVRGTSPLTLTLEPGTYQVAVESGARAITETIRLDAGQQAIYAPELTEEEPPVVSIKADRIEVAWDGGVTVVAGADDESGIARLEVSVGDETLAAVDGPELTLELAPADTPFAEPGQPLTLVASAADPFGNTSEATLVLLIGTKPEPDATSGVATPTETSSPVPSAPASLTAAPPATETPTPEPEDLTVESSAPTPEPTPVEQTSYELRSISLSSYPYWPFVKTVTDPLMGDYPVAVLNRPAYEGSGMQVTPRELRLLVLENRYLRITMLPDLGGRIYEVVYKPTGNNELYTNPVLKPTTWGPANPPYPAGANWWMAAGGIEWGFPVEEHGYEWSTGWGFDHVTTPDGGIMITVFNRTGPKAPYAVVDVILPPATAYFIVRPRIVNPWGEPFRFKWWSNAMLAPGPQNSAGENLRFVLPAKTLTVHSRADEELRGPGAEIDWPIAGGRDLSRLGNWTGYLGGFQRGAGQAGFAGVYDPTVDEGMVRVYPPDVAKGVKIFAPGWSEKLDPALWTDDGSTYVELHGGLAASFDDWYELGPGQEIGWAETWYPVAGIGGVTHAAKNAALTLSKQDGGLRIALFPTSAFRGEAVVSLPGEGAITRQLELAPDRPWVEVLPIRGSGAASIRLTTASGDNFYDWQGDIAP